MRIFSLLTLGIWASAAWAQPNETPANLNPPNAAPRPNQLPRPTEPKAQIEFDLRAFLGALNALAGYDVSEFLSGSRLGYFGLSVWQDEFVRARGPVRYEFGGVEFETLAADAARVVITYSLRAPGVEAARQEVETLDLKRETVPWNKEVRWRIVAPSYEESGQYQRLTLKNVAYFARQARGTIGQLRGEISASNLKQLALGALQFMQDYDEVFLFENDFYREGLRPYLKNDGLYTIPGTRDFYTFNDALSEKSIADVNEVAQTVLFYEGRDEKPEFRYEGKAAIGFADGSAKLLTPDEARKLIWKP